MRRCRTCGVDKDENCFTVFVDRDRGKRYPRLDCKDCQYAAARENYKQNIEARKKKQKEYAAKHWDRTAEYRKRRYAMPEVVEQIRKYKAVYMVNRRKKDNLFKLGQNIRGLIRQSFLKMKHNKRSKTIDIVGCDIESLKIHLESKFEGWMNWDNYGIFNGQKDVGWDIDHIKPVSSATNELDLIRLNHYSNLQPLCSYENRIRKRNYEIYKR